jgi:hypothetical protein
LYNFYLSCGSRKLPLGSRRSVRFLFNVGLTQFAVGLTRNFTEAQLKRNIPAQLYSRSAEAKKKNCPSPTASCKSPVSSKKMREPKENSLPPVTAASPDILLHPATHQCTGMYLHSGALLQRQRNELLSVPSASYQKVHF